MDLATPANMSKLINVHRRPADGRESGAMVDLFTGRYDRLRGVVGANTNDDELKRFADLLVEERKRRFKKQEEEKEIEKQLEEGNR